jgi:Leucine-rich repeat (LRR) protein
MLSRNLFSLDSETLVKLELTKNTISSIEPDAFDDLIRLKELQLDLNRIERLDENLLKNLLNLEVFSASENNLTAIEKNFFERNTKMKQIRLNRNNLASFQNGTFNTLINLQMLSIRRNFITEIDFSLFVFNLKLKSIDVSFNPLRKVNTLVGVELPYLAKLSIISNTTFDGLSLNANISSETNEDFTFIIIIILLSVTVFDLFAALCLTMSHYQRPNISLESLISM